MQLIAKLSRTKVARLSGLALLAAMALTYIGSTQAAAPVEFTVRVFKGDPANHEMVGGANILLVADDRSNPSHGLSATTDSLGLAVFSAVEPGAFNVEIRHPDYYGKDYHILIDANIELDATLVPLVTPPGPGGDCTPTPPRGQPMLNIWPIAESGADCTDYPLIAAQNVTRGGGYSHNLSGSTGDTIKVRLYVHNGTLNFPENEAVNAMVSARIQGGTISAEAWANNASRINSGQKGGNVNVSLSGNDFLEYVPGSARVYSRGPALIGAFPDSVVAGGASLGNMRGCYEFLRFVTFEVRIKTPVIVEPGNISVQKTVRNVSRSETAFVDQVAASPAEQVEFQIRVTASNGTVNNVNVSDALPSRLSFIPGSVTIDGSASGSSLSSIPLGNMNNNTRTILFRAQVASASEFPSSATLTNTATVTSSVGQAQDSASVVVSVVPPGNPTISITKTVRNVSRGQTAFTDSVSASPSEQVEFQVTVSTANATARNVVASDTLPSELQLNFISNPYSTNSTLSSIPLGDIAPGSSKVFQITATVGAESNFPANSTTTLRNIARAVADNAPGVSDSATVLVTRGGVGNEARLSITKLVRNLNSGSGFSHQTTAQTDDQLEFQITVTNTGSATANNVRVSDYLPSQIAYRNSTMRVNGNYNGGDFASSSLFVSLGNLTAGQTATINFQVTVLASGSAQITVTNTATASADNAPSVSDSATVYLSKVSGISLVLSKRAFNNTQNVDATQTTARPGEVITYTLSVQNSGTSDAASYVFQDDVADILELSELGNFSGANFDLARMVLTWPATVIPAGGRVEKTFTVTVRETFPAGTDMVMTNTFGNTVNVKVRGPFTAPATGSPATLSLLFAGLTAGAYAAYRKGMLAVLAKLFSNQN